MALYEKARRTELLHPDLKDIFVFCIGEFHHRLTKWLINGFTQLYVMYVRYDIPLNILT